MRGMTSSLLPPHLPLERYYPASEGAHDARRRFVTDLFDRTAPHYDWLNRVMSFGSGLRYREHAVARSGLSRGMKLLDVAVGTGLTSRAALNATDGTASVIGIDASAGMLQEARDLGIALVRGVAEQLPFAARSFDFLTMGYALRHVDDLATTFQEFRRVLRPGGRLLILELTRPAGSHLRYSLMRLYLKHVVPRLAQIGPGGSEARKLMEYYWDTINACVPPAIIIDALRAAGFQDVDHRLDAGVFSEYVAKRSD